MKNERIQGLSLPLDLLKFMHRVEIDKAHGWKAFLTNIDHYAVPEEVDAVCGFCNYHVALTCDSHQIDFNTQTVCMKGACRRCGEASTVLMTGLKPWAEFHGGKKPDEFWILPKPIFREVLVRKNSVSDDDIFEAYEEAIKLFNGGFWRASVTECGRALEGVTKDKFPTDEDRKTLGKISSNKDKEDPLRAILFSPILELSSAIRLGRMTGAHFKIKGSANREVASLVLDMTEYLMRYFYELSEDSKRLEAMIEALGDIKTVEEDSV